MGGYVKWIIAIETIALIVLLLIFFHAPQIPATAAHEVNHTGLLSPRVYEGILEPQSYLIVNYAPLRRELEEYTSLQNGTISVYVVNLRDGASMSINAQQGFIPASMSKVPVAILIMKKVEEGELSMNTLIPIQDSDRVEYSSTLYNTTASQLPLHTLIEKVLQESDNTAFKILLRYIEDDDNKILLNYWGFFNPESAHPAIPGSLITARSVYGVFSSLYLSTILEPQDSEYILGLLTNTVFDVGKIAQIPPEVRIAQKYSAWEQGDQTVFHSCGIMYPSEMKIFYCVMTEGFSEKEGVTHVATILNKIYRYSVETRRELNELKGKEQQLKDKE